MKRTVGWLGAVCVGIGLAAPVQAGRIDDGLAGILSQTPSDEVVSTLLFLPEQVDLNGATQQMDSENATLQRRHEFVVRLLQATADSTQGPLVEHLSTLLDAGRIQYFRPFWISNTIQVDAVPAEIEALAQRDDVGIIFYNYEMTNERQIRPVEPGDQPLVGDGGGPDELAPEPGLVAIRAPEVWALGITGQGRLVATLDTGADGNHPALRDRWRGLDSRYQGHPDWAFFDPVTGRDFPFDGSGHGTHTMGSVCGGAPGDEVGVAPGAEWIHAAVIDRVNIPTTVRDALLAFEWLIDPDGDPNTNFDVADSCSNSWRLVTGHGYPPCDETFWNHLDACEAAGIVIIFSAGNEGPGSRTIGRPPDRATDDYRTFSVGAVDANNSGWPIARFSSRGPSNCTPDGRDAIKPEIVAPGVDVRSSLPGNRYGFLSGTSMASPHINGVVALMREAAPNAAVNEIKQVIFDTAVDLGSTGDDNTYGWGMVDAFEAVAAIGNSNEPFACCFNDGSCSDLLRDECVAQGGRPNFGSMCSDGNCEQPGACCIDNATCEQMTRQNCSAAGGTFLGEGESCRRACPCDAIKKFKTKCKANGNIKAKVVYRKLDHEGEIVTFVVDGTEFTRVVFNRRAILNGCCYSGTVVIELTDPADCFPPQTVDCP